MRTPPPIYVPEIIAPVSSGLLHMKSISRSEECSQKLLFKWLQTWSCVIYHFGPSCQYSNSNQNPYGKALGAHCPIQSATLQYLKKSMFLTKVKRTKAALIFIWRFLNYLRQRRKLWSCTWQGSLENTMRVCVWRVHSRTEPKNSSTATPWIKNLCTRQTKMKFS